MKKIKLNNCPFCGGKVNVYKGTILMSVMYYAKCSKCEARQDFVYTDKSHPIVTKDGWQTKIEIITDKEAIQEVINKWNNPATE